VTAIHVMTSSNDMNRYIEGDDNYNDTTNNNVNPTYKETSIDYYSNIAEDGTANESANTGTGTTTTNTRKRTTIDESALSQDDLEKLENRRSYNRQCAAKGRLDLSIIVHNVVDSMNHVGVNVYVFPFFIGNTVSTKFFELHSKKT
jgi:hypothetical protein